MIYLSPIKQAPTPEMITAGIPTCRSRLVLAYTHLCPNLISCNVVSVLHAKELSVNFQEFGIYGYRSDLSLPHSAEVLLL